MKTVLNPISCAATPSHRRWECIRSSSATIVRMYWARFGISSFIASSIPFTNTVVWLWEQIPHTRSRSGTTRTKSRASAAFSIPRWL